MNTEFLPYDKITHINEWNSGNYSNKEFSRTLDEIMNLVDIRLSMYSPTKKISEIDPFIAIRYSLNIQSLSLQTNDNMGYLSKELTIILEKDDKRAGQQSDLFLNGGTHLSKNMFVIRVGIELNNTIKDILNNIDKLKEIVSHELVHVFQNLYDNYQKTQTYYNKLKNSAPEDDYGNTYIFGNPNYWSSRHEIEAYITQVNTELKNIKKSDKNITFKSAILRSKGWRDFMNTVAPHKREKIQKKMLSKIAHYWTSQLNGKLNEHKKKLHYINYE